MPVTMYVTRYDKVEIPDDRTELEAFIDRESRHQTDADIIKASDAAIAVFLVAQSDNRQMSMVEIIDVEVSDVDPCVTQEVTDGP
jgi:hypothetical protein